MRTRLALVWALLGTGGFLVALRLLPGSSDLALLAFVLFLAALALARAVNALSAVLPPAGDLERFLRPEPTKPRPADQIEAVKELTRGSRRALPELRSTLRPLVHDVVASRLLREHGVDLEREPERARALLGEGRAWQLLSAPSALLQGGESVIWSRHELEQLVTELEGL